MEANGKDKNIKLKFEGQYINGERNGKGKEYNKNVILEFEGEYLNGKRWNGIEKKYHDNGKLKFNGEYLIGKRNGKGKEYIMLSKIIFFIKFISCHISSFFD